MSVQAPPQDPAIESEIPHEPPPWSRRQWALAGIVSAIAIALAAIPLLSQLTADDDAAVDEPAVTATTASAPTTVTTTPVTTAPPVEEVIRAQYFEFWRVYDAYVQGTGPFDPVEFKALFGPVATNGEYEQVFRGLQLNRLKGIAGRGGGPQDQAVQSVVMDRADSATIRDCAADTGELYNVATGEQVSAPRQGRTLLYVRMVLEEGMWKVASIADSRQSCDV